MLYKSLSECVLDLEENGHLVRIHDEVDPDQEMAEIHRRVYRVGGPALMFEKVKGSPFSCVSNLFGTEERARFIFRRTWNRAQKAFELKAQPQSFFKSPFRYLELAKLGWTALPQKVMNGPVFECETTIDQLPQIKCWRADGGAFILLPQVYTEDIERPGVWNSNTGMYRIQMSGNEYRPNQEIGLHYQIRRDIGIHHTKALAAGRQLRVSIFIGGPPAHTFAAVMYLPEGLAEMTFAGALAGRRFRYVERDGFKISADADFCITGWVDPAATKPEGPFGDHLGYYSLKHPFPFMKVEKVYHRKDAIWPFTVVGRPPQEDTTFGKLIQQLAGPVIPKELPGVKAVHAVDAAGVHPLLLALGSERYAPFQKKKPRELLTLANALLGYGPCSLAKYLLIASADDAPNLDVHDIPSFFRHILERIDWKRDVHFQTSTTIDTLDYSGTDINEGSKVILAAAGEKKRSLSAEIPARLEIPTGFGSPRVAMPGVLVVQAPPFDHYEAAAPEISMFSGNLASIQDEEGIALVVLVDDSEFAAHDLNTFLWVTFTRSNPSHDIYGTRGCTQHKHWGCHGPLIIDARVKPHHAPPLVEDREVSKRVDKRVQSGPLHKILAAKGKPVKTVIEKTESHLGPVAGG